MLINQELKMTPMETGEEIMGRKRFLGLSVILTGVQGESV